MTTYGAIPLKHAAGILAQVFGDEWPAISRADAELVCADYLCAVDEDNCGAREYQRRIGRGNLQSYADCLRVHK